VCCYISLLCDGVITTSGLAGAWDLQGQQGREQSAWRPGTLSLAGRGRRKLFGLSAWFAGPSGPDNAGKGTNT